MESAENREKFSQPNQSAVSSPHLSKVEIIKLLNESIDRLKLAIEKINESGENLPSSNSINTLIDATKELAPPPPAPVVETTSAKEKSGSTPVKVKPNPTSAPVVKTPANQTNANIPVEVKLRPGQCIKLSTHSVKGIGRDHAKFSPVATATYRLLPHIQILKPIVGADARKFARCFPKGVIALEPFDPASSSSASTTGAAGKNSQNNNNPNKRNTNNNNNDDNNNDDDDAEDGHASANADNVRAVVCDPMRDTVSRECLRHEEFKDKVKLGRVRDHFIFRIESTGQWDGDELFLESVRVLKLKCAIMKKGLEGLMRV